MRPSSVAPDPAESRGAPPPPQDPSPLRGTLGSSLCQCRRRKRREFDPWVRKIRWTRTWQSTPPMGPGASAGSLVGMARVQRTPGLLPTHWWVKPGPGVSARHQGFPDPTSQGAPMCSGLIPLRGLEGVPGLPGAPQEEAGLTRKFETSHV